MVSIVQYHVYNGINCTIHVTMISIVQYMLQWYQLYNTCYNDINCTIHVTMVSIVQYMLQWYQLYNTWYNDINCTIHVTMISIVQYMLQLVSIVQYMLQWYQFQVQLNIVLWILIINFRINVLKNILVHTPTIIYKSMVEK